MYDSSGEVATKQPTKCDPKFLLHLS